MTNDQLRILVEKDARSRFVEPGKQPMSFVESRAIIRLLNEHKLLLETLEKIGREYTDEHGEPHNVPAHIVADALANVAK